MSSLSCLKTMGNIVGPCTGHANSVSCCSKVVSSGASSLSNALPFDGYTQTLSKPDAPLLSPTTIPANSTNEDHDYKKSKNATRRRSQLTRRPISFNLIHMGDSFARR